MHIQLKKILVFLPVGLLGMYYLRNHMDLYHQVSGRRLAFLALSFLVLYGWIFFAIVSRQQRSLMQMIIESSFYVYLFMVLTLTGYFILFREVSAHGWWDKMMMRIDRKDHVNLELFKIFKIYKMSNTQIVGNFIMLLPLGIYLPLLYRRLAGFFPVLLTAFFVSVTIELLQLITSFRSADVDDVLLNTAGACFGYLLYRVVRLLLLRPVTSGTLVTAENQAAFNKA